MKIAYNIEHVIVNCFDARSRNIIHFSIQAPHKMTGRLHS